MKLEFYGKDNIKIKNKIIDVPNLGDHRICMASLILSLLLGIKLINSLRLLTHRLHHSKNNKVRSEEI